MALKEMEIAVNRARKAEDEYIVSICHEFKALRADSIPRHRFLSEQAELRHELEKNQDSQLKVLPAETKRLQEAIADSYPEAFKSVDKAVEKIECCKPVSE